MFRYLILLPGRLRPLGSRVAVLGFALFVSSCATGPIELTSPVAKVSVLEFRSQMNTDTWPELVNDSEVLWGGIILKTSNQAEQTQIELMAYPLDGRQRPRPHRDAHGRFLINHSGYLDPVDFAPGRAVTVSGSVSEIVVGLVGEAEYTYPTLQAKQLHLWNQRTTVSRPAFSFGIGIGIGN